MSVAPAVGRRLEGRVTLVTGAAVNIGAAIARRLAAEGASVAVNYRSAGSATAAADVVAEIMAAGGTAAAFEADVGDAAAVREMVAAIETRLGPVDCLVNNAARSVASDVGWLDLEPEDWDDVLRANVTGPFICARAVYDHMRRRGGGSIINVSSIRVLLGLAGNVHYTASKAALIGFTRTLARETGPDGIRVNCVVVGAIRTPAEAVYGEQESLDERVLSAQSLGRRGVPDDVGSVAAFLLSDDAAFLTGQLITVDGGWAMN